MAERLIIDNRTDLPMGEALGYARAVVMAGRVSTLTRKGQEVKTYCWLTTWGNGIRVANFVNDGSERLMIYREED